MSTAETGPMNCEQCGTNLSQGNVLDYYELRLRYAADAKREFVNRRLDEIVGIDRSLTRSEPHENILSGFFCGSKCLSRYVQMHVEPDAAT